MVLRDIESISERFEAPGGFVEGLQIFIEADDVSIVPNHFLRPMRLTRSELLALELGLAMLRNERPREEHRAIAGAMARLGQAVARLPGEEIADDAAHRSPEIGIRAPHADGHVPAQRSVRRFVSERVDRKRSPLEQTIDVR